MSGSTKSALALLAAALAGCGITPYVLPADAKIAQLNIASAGRAWICADGEAHSLKADPSGRVAIAAGERVTVGAAFYAQGYNVSYSCSPRASFVPVPGGTYYENFELENEHCGVYVFKESASNPTGLDFEPTFQLGGGCK